MKTDCQLIRSEINDDFEPCHQSNKSLHLKLRVSLITTNYNKLYSRLASSRCFCWFLNYFKRAVSHGDNFHRNSFAFLEGWSYDNLHLCNDAGHCSVLSLIKLRYEIVVSGASNKPVVIRVPRQTAPRRYVPPYLANSYVPVYPRTNVWRVLWERHRGMKKVGGVVGHWVQTRAQLSCDTQRDVYACNTRFVAVCLYSLSAKGAA